jgi:hypothetical protein
MLQVKKGKFPALLDTGAQFSCVRSDVVKFLFHSGEPCRFLACSVPCLLADGKVSEVKDAVKLEVKILTYSWQHEFKILPMSPFPAILGLDFLQRTQMVIDVPSRRFNFRFAPDQYGSFVTGDSDGTRGEDFFQVLMSEALAMLSLPPNSDGVSDLSSVYQEFPRLFSSRLGTARCAPYQIDLVDSTPVRSPPYRCAPPKMRIFREMVDDLLADGVIRPSRSPYASPAFLVPKNGGGFRLVVDFRKVNTKIMFDSYPMPTIDQAFEQFGGATIFSVFDLNSAYFQIPLSARSRRITAFCTPFGLYEFNKLPMGISVGSQGLSRVIDELFADQKGKYVFNFLDDLVVYSPTRDDHLTHVREVLGRLHKAGFTVNPEECTLAAREIKYLGHILSATGIRVLPDRITAILQYPPPANLKALRRFMGMVGFYGRFIPEFSGKSAVLHDLKKKGVRFEWRAEHQAAFEGLKRALSSAPVLQIPDFGKEFVLATDASERAISTVLQQRVENDLAPISYYSRVLSPAERQYSVYEKECLAVLFGCEKARSYLEHKEFELCCDNLALCWLLKRGKDVGRWVLRLSPFKFSHPYSRG